VEAPAPPVPPPGPPILALSALVAVLAAAAGGGTAWLVVSGMSGGDGPPGGATIVGVPPRTLEAEKENATLREEVRRLQGEVAEARISAAARKAFPDGNPAVRGDTGGPPNDAILEELTAEERTKFDRYFRALREREDRVHRLAAAEAELRSRLDRGFGDGGIDAEDRERLVRLLMEGSEKMRDILETAGRRGGDRDEASREVDALGQETRRRLGEFLSEEQIRVLDRVLGGPQPPEEPAERDPLQGR